jgi:large subunit ribosomal protein L24
MAKWTKTWKASKQPRRQHAYTRNAPQHTLGSLLASHMSKELRQKYRQRSIRIRTGDKVRIMRGTYRNRTGKVERVDTKKQKAYITGIEVAKRDGSKALVPLHPSNLLIQELDLADKRRLGQTEAKTK